MVPVTKPIVFHLTGRKEAGKMGPWRFPSLDEVPEELLNKMSSVFKLSFGFGWKRGRKLGWPPNVTDTVNLWHLFYLKLALKSKGSWLSAFFFLNYISYLMVTSKVAWKYHLSMPQEDTNILFQNYWDCLKIIHINKFSVICLELTHEFTAIHIFLSCCLDSFFGFSFGLIFHVISVLNHLLLPIP